MATNTGPKVVCTSSSCRVRWVVSGKVLSTSNPFVRWLIASTLAERMLEYIRRLGGQASLVEQLGLDQLAQALLQRHLVHRPDRPQELVGKLPTDGRSQLRHCLRRIQPIQSRDQRVVQCNRNGQCWQWSGQLIPIIGFADEPRLQNHLGQFFYKQRHAISPGEQLLTHLSR